jgi:hypothetical protein
MSPINCKWIFCKKYNVDGSIFKYKTQFVPQGFFQEFGIDYHEMFNLVVKLTSFLILFLFVATLDFEIHQMDVCITILNGTLHEEIFMQQPKGYI